MSKLQKCLYLIDLLERRGPMTLKEINEHYRYSSQYESDIQPRTFLRYKDYNEQMSGRTLKWISFRAITSISNSSGIVRNWKSFLLPPLAANYTP